MEISTASQSWPAAGEAVTFVPYAVVDGDPGRGLVLLCDHANNALPPEYGDLGLPAREFQRHIAYDPGARELTEMLAERLHVPAVFGMFSRLLIDPNRGEDDPTLIMRISDGSVVPGNRDIDETERRRRVERYYAPYHEAVRRTIDAGMASGTAPAIVSIHTFTPIWHGRPRPWHVGVLWDRDARVAAPTIEALRRDSDLIVGDNEPYTGQLTNDTLNRHATARGLAHALIEVRQDLIADDAGVRRWADIFEPILIDVNERPEVHEMLPTGPAGSHAVGVAAV